MRTQKYFSEIFSLPFRHRTTLTKLLSLPLALVVLALASSPAWAEPTMLPTAPTGLVSSTATTTTVKLTWLHNPPGDYVTGYNVYQDGARVATETGNTYTVQGLSPGSNHSFYVTALNDLGEGPASSSVSVTTVAVTTPRGLKITNLSDTSVSLAWEGDAGLYRVYLDNVRVAETNQTQYTITGMQPQQNYSVHITSVGYGDQESETSNRVNLSTPETPAPLTLQSAADNVWPYVRMVAPYLGVAMAIIFTFLIADNLTALYRKYSSF